MQPGVPLDELKTPTHEFFERAKARLNRDVAIAELDGPDAGLAVLDTLALDDYRYYHSTRADLLRRAGRTGDARAAYARAFELAETDPERQFLARQLEDLA